MNDFNERAKDWDSDPAKVERARIVAEAIRPAIPSRPGLSALEYGCGTGLLSFALQPNFASITLADTSQGMLDVLSAKIKAAGVDNMHPLHLDLSTAPAPDSRYSVIYSLMTLHHIPDTDTVLRQFFALLETPGWLCIADLEKEDGTCHGQHITDVHRGFERADLQARLEAAGFRDVHFSSVYAVKKLVNGIETAFPLFLVTAQKG